MRYFSLYAIGVLAAYSLIPYKTPWCVISIIWPFALLFGVGLCSIKCERLFFGIAGVALLASLVFCLQLNFWHYVDFSEPYVYVQTSPEIKRITDPLLSLAKKNPRNLQLRGQIVLESYYPLPWILGDFRNVGYYSKNQPPKKWDGDFIIVDGAQAPQVEQELQEPYDQIPFQLRDAMEPCVGFFKKSIMAQQKFR